MNVLGSIEVTFVTDKQGRIYHTAWIEAGNRAIYLSDPEAKTVVVKALEEFRRLTGETGNFVYRETPFNGDGVRFEIGKPTTLKAVAS